MTPDDSNNEDGKLLSSYSNIFETSSVIFLAAETSDQHKESTKSRQERDNKDLMTVVNFLNERNPFIENS
jgi:hypothetical protein